MQLNSCIKPIGPITEDITEEYILLTIESIFPRIPMHTDLYQSRKSLLWVTVTHSGYPSYRQC